MAQREKSNEAISSAEKKGVTSIDEEAIRRQAEEFNSWLDRMKAMDSVELKKYREENKDTFSSQKEEAMKRLQKDRPKKERKRSVLSPIMGAVLKFHRDDDVDPPAPGATA